MRVILLVTVSYAEIPTSLPTPGSSPLRAREQDASNRARRPRPLGICESDRPLPSMTAMTQRLLSSVPDADVLGRVVPERDWAVSGRAADWAVGGRDMSKRRSV